MFLSVIVKYEKENDFQTFNENLTVALFFDTDMLKEKINGKRDRSRTVTIKRNEVTNDLKRKTNNRRGQIKENQRNNNRRKVNGIR